MWGGGGGWHKASVSGCLPLAAPIGLSPLLILTLCGPERVLVVSTEPSDDLSCLTTPGVSRPGDGAVARAVGVGGGGSVYAKFGGVTLGAEKIWLQFLNTTESFGTTTGLWHNKRRLGRWLLFPTGLWLVAAILSRLVAPSGP